MSKVDQGIRVEKIEYYRQIKPPTLKQYLFRRKMAEVMVEVRNKTGVVYDQETHRPIPRSAHLAKQLLKGLTSDIIALEHPEWVECYEQGNHLEPRISRTF